MNKEYIEDSFNAEDWQFLQEQNLGIHLKNDEFDDENPSPCDSESQGTGVGEPPKSQAKTEDIERLNSEQYDQYILDIELAIEYPESTNLDSNLTGPVWPEFILDSDEYDVNLVREEIPDEVLVDGKLPTRERARQVAIDLGLKYGWDESGVKVLAELFDTPYWGPTKLAVEKLLQFKITQEELEITIQLRELWRDRAEFSIDLGSSFLGELRWKMDASASIHSALSWQDALRMVRVSTGIPDVF